MSKFSPENIAKNFVIICALITKDWRFFRPQMIALLIAGVGSYLLGMIANYFSALASFQIGQIIAGAAAGASHLTALLAAILGGAALAGERSDRSADFIAVLPVTRAQIILSKWLVSAFMLITCGVFHAGISLCVQLPVEMHRQAYEFQHDAAVWGSSAALIIACAMSYFGIAWLLSTFASSASIVACASIAVTVVTVFSILVLDNLDHTIQNEWKCMLDAAASALTIGLLCVVAGTIYYIKRVAP